MTMFLIQFVINNKLSKNSPILYLLYFYHIYDSESTEKK